MKICIWAPLILGFDDFSPGDVDKFSKSFTGRRHALDNTDEKSFSLIEGMFANQIDGGNMFVHNIFVFMNYLHYNAKIPKLSIHLIIS